jgi:hypothetical protein
MLCSNQKNQQAHDATFFLLLVGAGGKMDDITVIVAQVNIVVIPDDEVDL